jgi:hypothetical protein
MVSRHSKMVHSKRNSLIRHTKKSSKKSMTRKISNAVRSTMTRVSKML